MHKNNDIFRDAPYGLKKIVWEILYEGTKQENVKSFESLMPTNKPNSFLLLQEEERGNKNKKNVFFKRNQRNN